MPAQSLETSARMGCVLALATLLLLLVGCAGSNLGASAATGRAR